METVRKRFHNIVEDEFIWDFEVLVGKSDGRNEQY